LSVGAEGDSTDSTQSDMIKYDYSGRLSL